MRTPIERIPISSGKVVLFDPETLLLLEQTRNSEGVPRLTAVQSHPAIQKIRAQVGNHSKPTGGRVKTMDMNVMSGCNLRCMYCFAGAKGDYDAGGHAMDMETASRSVDLMLSDIHPQESLVIRFFGGEPLLNFPLIQQVVPYARQKAEAQKKQVQFIITTNGTVTKPDVIRFLSSNLSEICVSLDGPAEIHNRQRPKVSNQGSFESTLTFIQQIQDSPNFTDGQIQINCTVLPTLLTDGEYLQKIVQFFLQAGIGYINILYALSQGTEHRINFTEANLTLLKENLEKLTDWYLQRCNAKILPKPVVYNLFYFFSFFLSQKLLIQTNCGLGESLVSLTSRGQLTSCSKMQHVQEFSIGNVYDGFSQERRTFFTNYRNKPCSTCFLKNMTERGCLANHYGVQGEAIARASCELRHAEFYQAVRLFMGYLENNLINSDFFIHPDKVSFRAVY